MSRRQLLVALGFVVCVVIIGGAAVKILGGTQRDLARVLGPAADEWIGNATIAAWQPDPNMKAYTYYAVRAVDEAAYRQLAARSGLTVAPSAAATEAVWKVPSGVKIDNWSPAAVAAGAGLDARGKVGGAMCYSRWHDQRMWLVVMPDGE